MDQAEKDRLKKVVDLFDKPVARCAGRGRQLQTSIERPEPNIWAALLTARGVMKEDVLRCSGQTLIL